MSNNIPAISDFVVGADAAASNFFNGTIDDVMIFDRVLSQEEITAIYEAQAKVGS